MDSVLLYSSAVSLDDIKFQFSHSTFCFINTNYFAAEELKETIHDMFIEARL